MPGESAAHWLIELDENLPARQAMPNATGQSGQGNAGGWPSTTGNPSGGGRSNNAQSGGGGGGQSGGGGGKK